MENQLLKANGEPGDENPTHYSNQTVLAVTCASFALFVVAEIIGALASNSLSLLGDAGFYILLLYILTKYNIIYSKLSAAMSVDVMSYFCNMFAEYVKSKKA